MTLSKRERLEAKIVGGTIGAIIALTVTVYLPMRANYECHGRPFIPQPGERQTGPTPC